MLNTKDGGQAFPFATMDSRASVGMSLRDYFAAKALPEAIDHERDLRASMIQPEAFRYDRVAEAAYVMADAMLRERAK